MALTTGMSARQDWGVANSDSVAIKKIVSDFESAFNKHNAKELAILFNSNAEFTNVVGAYTIGN